MDKKIGSTINCACVIHSNHYDWQYVDKLYNMLTRNLSRPVVMHVYTEAHRSVPSHMIKHELEDLGVGGYKKSWWYKLQLFNAEHYRGPLLYFDLDIVIADHIDWITAQPLDYFWAARDFRRLWNPSHTGINSSVMWWDTGKFHDIWLNFKKQEFGLLQRRYPGDQDFLSDMISQNRRRFLDENLIKSWKWECFDGGYDFRRRTNFAPGTGTKIKNTSVLVFHGKPNPHEIQDPVISQHWQ